MDHFQFDPRIADAIVTGRILRIPSLKGMAEHSMGTLLSPALWASLEPKWMAHAALSEEELTSAVGQPPHSA